MTSHNSIHQSVNPKAAVAGFSLVDTIKDYSAHDQTTFFNEFIKDLNKAQENVIPQSPYITGRRLEALLPALKQAPARGIRLCIFVREPDFWEQRQSPNLPHDAVAMVTEAERLLLALRDAGAHVNVRKKAHEKLAVIDNMVLWSGSLNALSHRDTAERMTRMVSRHYATETIVKHKLDTCDECTGSELCK